MPKYKAKDCTCEICGKKFIGTIRSKYCSQKCNNKAYRQRHPKRWNEIRRKSYHNCLDRVHAENKRNYERHKEIRKEQAKQYRLENPEKVKQMNDNYRKQHRKELILKKHQELKEFKVKWYSNLFCDRCGSTENLHYHHLNPKTKICNINKMVWKNPLEILTEMSKCIVLCNSCHGQLHANKRWGNPTFV